MRSAGLQFTIVEDKLDGAATRALLALHLSGMHASSPEGKTFALDRSGLLDPAVTVWSVRDGEVVAGIGALKALGQNSGEIKSMRTHLDYLRRGVAAMLLDHMLAEARRRGYERLSLETGSGPAFDPAFALYRSYGFREGRAFAEYQPNGFSRFLHLPLRAPGIRSLG